MGKNTGLAGIVAGLKEAEQMDRDWAIKIAQQCAKAKPQSYTEPFQPHEWVIDAVLRGADEAARRTDTGEVRRLAEHWLFEMRCDHEAETDTSFCACGRWNSEPQPNVGEAAIKWAEHALAADSAARSVEKEP